MLPPYASVSGSMRESLAGTESEEIGANLAEGRLYTLGDVLGVDVARGTAAAKCAIWSACPLTKQARPCIDAEDHGQKVVRLDDAPVRVAAVR
jgi:hypothetical protein